MKWIRKRSGFSPAGIITSAELTLIQMAVRLVLEATAIPFALAARRDWIERVPVAQLKRLGLWARASLGAAFPLWNRGGALSTKSW